MGPRPHRRELHHHTLTGGGSQTPAEVGLISPELIAVGDELTAEIPAAAQPDACHQGHDASGSR
jgi:hypothetical protein